MQLRRVVTTASLAALVVLGSALPVAAKAGDIRTSGDCSARTDWKLKVAARDAGYEVEWSVDQNRNGVAWTYEITDNGTSLRAGVATTIAPSGSFTVKARTANLAGTDTIHATASNAAGETCAATIAVP